MPRWDTRTFTDVFEDESAGNVKTLQSEYLQSGEYPIVDQGKALIGGFTDDPTRLCKSLLPVIVFGDHTKCLKYVDFPFCLGADGTKILRPKIEADAKYLYYFLRTVYIPEAGYSRHFKYLKQSEIPLPPIEEQERIAAILDQADTLRRLRQRAIDRLNTLGQAIFYEMFGDPRTNALGWRTKTLGEIGILGRGVSKHRPRNDPVLLGGKHPLVQTGDVANADGFIRNYQATYSDSGLRQSKLWPRGTLCITIAANIGKTAILDFDACFPDSVVGFTPGPDTTTEYVQYWFAFIQEKLEREAPQSAQKNINLAILSELEIPLPPFGIQQRFSQCIKEVDSRKLEFKDHLKVSCCLFSSLQHRAFRGEL
jgi:type I restriction enzyme S subunit